MFEPASLTLEVALEVLGRTVASGVRTEWARRVSRMIRIAERDSGLSREDLAERIGESPELVPLVTRIVFLAGTRGSDDVLMGLGSLLGATVGEPTRIDEAEVMLAVLERLTNAHIHMLRQAHRSCTSATRVDRTTLLRGSSLPEGTARMCLNDLLQMDLLAEAHTHMQKFSVSQVPQYEVTVSGATVLEVLAAAANVADR